MKDLKTLLNMNLLYYNLNNKHFEDFFKIIKQNLSSLINFKFFSNIKIFE